MACFSVAQGALSKWSEQRTRERAQSQHGAPKSISEARHPSVLRSRHLSVRRIARRFRTKPIRLLWGCSRKQFAMSNSCLGNDDAGMLPSGKIPPHETLRESTADVRMPHWSYVTTAYAMSIKPVATTPWSRYGAGVVHVHTDPQTGQIPFRGRERMALPALEYDVFNARMDRSELDRHRPAPGERSRTRPRWWRSLSNRALLAENG